MSSPASKKPPGILWDRLSPQKLDAIRILQQLKQRIEDEQGAPLPTGPDEALPPVAQRGQHGPGGGRGGRGGGRGGRGGGRSGRGGGRSGQQRQRGGVGSRAGGRGSS